MNCTVKVPAKINLSLDVVGKRPDGYHLLETVMQSVDLYDTVKVSIVELSSPKKNNMNAKGNNVDTHDIRIIADNPTFPCDSRNTCYKAAERFVMEYEKTYMNLEKKSKNETKYFNNTNSNGNNEYKNCNIKGFPENSTDNGKHANKETIKQETGCSFFTDRQILIHITKNIPQAAGLAGGSADAAAVLVALNHLCDSPFSEDALSGIGVKVGADVPFCLTGGTVLCSGIGEILEPLSPLNPVPLVLVKPNFGVSTPWVFNRLNLNQMGNRPDTHNVLERIAGQDIEGLFKETANVLESVTLPAYSVLSRIKDKLLKLGAIGAIMSGSGPTIFAIFPSKTAAESAVAAMKEVREFSSYTIIRTGTIQNGPVIIPEEHNALAVSSPEGRNALAVSSPEGRNAPSAITQKEVCP